MDALTRAMTQVESGGDPRAISSAGAVGLMQVKPDTAMRPGFGLPSIFDFAESTGVTVGRRNKTTAANLLKDPTLGAAYGQRYMDAMLQRYNGNLPYALAAYNAGPGRVDKWLAAGADPAKLPKETRDYVPKVLAALQAQGAPTPGAVPGAAPAPAPAPAPAAAPAPGVAPTAAQAQPQTGLAIPGVAPTAPTAEAPAPAPAPAPAAVPTPELQESDFYLANPASIPYDTQNTLQTAQEEATFLTNQRNQYARYGQFYMQSGNPTGALQMQQMVGEIDARLMALQQGTRQKVTYLEGMQGIQEFTLANDPRRLAAVWSQYAGVPIGIQPRSDGKFDIVVNGKKTKEGVSATGIIDSARSGFDATYRQQKSALSATQGQEAFKAQLDIAKENAKQTADMIKQIAVKRVEGGNQFNLELLKQNRYDVKPTGAGDGTVIITPPGGGAPVLFNPSGRTVEVDGVKITSNAAYPILGLPSYGGQRTTR
jgi:hypothetical protein